MFDFDELDFDFGGEIVLASYAEALDSDDDGIAGCTKVEQIKENLETGGFFLNCKIPPEYRAVFPILQIKNGSLCIIFPYLKYQTAAGEDRPLVCPIRYTISLELPTEKILGFEDLEYNEVFKDVDFDKPAGYFCSEAAREYGREEYDVLYHRLMEEYDKVIRVLLEGGVYDFSDERRMSELLQLLTAPSMLSVYQFIDKDFFKIYLAEGQADYGS